MSLQAMTRVMDGSALTGSAYVVMLVIANHEGDHDGETWAYPSVDRIAREARISRRTAIYGVSIAEQAGELLVRKNSGPKGTNLYKVLVGGADSARPRGAAPARSASTHRANDGPSSAPERKELGVGSSSAEGSSSGVTDIRAPRGARAEFEAFWAVYPIRRGKGAAFRAFIRALKRAPAAEIITGAQRYRDDAGRDPDKTKYAEGWLNADRWSDEILTSDDRIHRLVTERLAGRQ